MRGKKIPKYCVECGKDLIENISPQRDRTDWIFLICPAWHDYQAPNHRLHSYIYVKEQTRPEKFNPYTGEPNG